MGLSQKNMLKSNANMHNGHPSTGSALKWPQTLSLVAEAATKTEARLVTFLAVNMKWAFNLPKNIQNKSYLFFPLLFPLLPSPPSLFLSASTACTITTPITNATKNMHKVVAHSNMIKWCVVWRHSRHLSHPSLSAAPYLLSSARKQTRDATHARHRFPSPEPCFQNRSLVLTVNRRADRYGPGVGSAGRHQRTHEECGITRRGRARPVGLRRSRCRRTRSDLIFKWKQQYRNTREGGQGGVNFECFKLSVSQHRVQDPNEESQDKSQGSGGKWQKGRNKYSCSFGSLCEWAKGQEEKHTTLFIYCKL